MVEFAHPWMLLLLLLPIPIRLLPAFRQRGDSVHAPFYERLQAASGEEQTTSAIVLQRSRFQSLLLPLAWLLLVIAAGKPELLGQPIEQTKSARDLMIAVDLSGSMQAEDFVLELPKPGGEPGETVKTNVDRLRAVKYVLNEFADQRKHDRFGLIVFGNAPYLQVPFTDDHDTWLTLLNETEISMAGQSTVIGDSIGLAIKLFEKSDIENRVLIVLTDGNDTGSTVPPIDAAKVAAKYDIKIYTIAIGDPQTVGEEAIDVRTLERVAEVTGGAFFQALNPEELANVYVSIAELEPEDFETTSFQPRTSLHHYPVILLALIYLVFFVMSILTSKKTEKKSVATQEVRNA